MTLKQTVHAELNPSPTGKRVGPNAFESATLRRNKARSASKYSTNKWKRKRSATSYRVFKQSKDKTVKQNGAVHSSSSATELFQIESVLRVRNKSPDEREYLVKWLGYELKDASWEPEVNLLADCPAVLESFHAQQSR